MSPKTILAYLIGKLILLLIKTKGTGGGFAAPGYYALKIDPNFLLNTQNLIPKTVLVTGTNGKTTTSRMIAHFLKSQKIKVIRNHTGSNLERGIVSQIIQSFSLGDLIQGKQSQKYDLAVWELDEAAFNHVALKVKPDVMLFLNIYRDQLDRYGEIDNTISKWNKTLTQIKNSGTILINGDDTNLHQLADYYEWRSLFFGVKDHKIEGEKTLIESRPQKLTYQAENIQTQGLQSTTFNLKTKDLQLKTTLPLPGLYHIYDFVAAAAVIDTLELPLEKLSQDVQTFSPAFGRVEQIKLQTGKTGYIFLIKNPTGATQVLDTIKDELQPQDSLFVALNDNFADGTDVSWIWDTQWEQLRIENSDHACRQAGFRIYISGTRAYDAAIRLKYAGFDPQSFVITSDVKELFLQAQQQTQGRLFILPTYTALLELQSILKELKIKEDYWKEN